MKRADAARGYEMFEEKEGDCRKIVLTPWTLSPAAAAPSTGAYPRVAPPSGNATLDRLP